MIGLAGKQLACTFMKQTGAWPRDALCPSTAMHIERGETVLLTLSNEAARALDSKVVASFFQNVFLGQRAGAAMPTHLLANPVTPHRQPARS